MKFPGTLLVLAAVGAMAWLWQADIAEQAGAQSPFTRVPTALEQVVTATVEAYPHAAAALTDVAGARVRLDELHGHWAVLNFWASYCPYCRHEMPELEAMHRAGQDVMIVGVNLGEDRETIRAFLEQVSVSYPVWLDQEGALATAFGVLRLPATLLLDPQGNIRWLKLGTVSVAQLQAQLARARAP